MTPTLNLEALPVRCQHPSHAWPTGYRYSPLELMECDLFVNDINIYGDRRRYIHLSLLYFVVMFARNRAKVCQAAENGGMAWQ